MAYEAALDKAWEALASPGRGRRLNVSFLGEEYSVNLKERAIVSRSSGAPPKGYLAILLLHYLAARLKRLPRETGKWISFRELAGGEGYWPAFRQRVIDPILRKYGADPHAMASAIERFKARMAPNGQPGIILEAFEGVPVMICLWPADEEFPTDATFSFDRGAGEILPTEDIVVMSEFIARRL
jgi:hypothetical protein